MSDAEAQALDNLRSAWSRAVHGTTLAYDDVFAALHGQGDYDQALARLRTANDDALAALAAYHAAQQSI